MDLTRPIRAVCSECAELRRIARHFGIGRTLAEGLAVLAFVAAIGGASLALVEPSPTPSHSLVAEARR